MSQRKTDETFLSRWSRRKLEAARAQPGEAPVPAAPVPAEPNAPERLLAAGAPAAPTAAPAPELPPVESLTFDSDFRVFMQPGVDADVQRAALRKLLHDPRFNVMDGLDVYIDDYTKPSPLAADLVRKLAHARYLFSPPRTRVNADGVVEDVPESESVGEPTHAQPAAIAAADPNSLSHPLSPAPGRALPEGRAEGSTEEQES